MIRGTITNNNTQLQGDQLVGSKYNLQQDHYICPRTRQESRFPNHEVVATPPPITTYNKWVIALTAGGVCFLLDLIYGLFK